MSKILVKAVYNLFLLPEKTLRTDWAEGTGSRISENTCKNFEHHVALFLFHKNPENKLNSILCFSVFVGGLMDLIGKDCITVPWLHQYYQMYER